ncbi:uncharacterized protein LOC123946008 [Meles meles]|uniref:uncharacterized protein LOC123946008 n=1 Tax=Meles meles TaxID=9662 RepID=UPI001E69F036|nr:uncharacterized protein LOC123946008 [Meles meles]
MEAKDLERRGIEQWTLALPETGWHRAYGSLSWMILLQMEAFPQLCVRRKVSPYSAPHARPAWCEELRTEHLPDPYRNLKKELVDVSILQVKYGSSGRRGARGQPAAGGVHAGSASLTPARVESFPSPALVPGHRTGFRTAVCLARFLARPGLGPTGLQGPAQDQGLGQATQQLVGMGPGVVTVGAAVDSAECWPGSREVVMLWGPMCEPGRRTRA